MVWVKNNGWDKSVSMGVLKKGGETRNRGGLDLAQICANATHLLQTLLAMLFLDFGILSIHQKLQDYIILTQEYVVSFTKEKEQVLIMN